MTIEDDVFTKANPQRSARAKEASWYSKVYKFDLQPGSLTDQVAGEHQPSKKLVFEKKTAPAGISG